MAFHRADPEVAARILAPGKKPGPKRRPRTSLAAGRKKRKDSGKPRDKELSEAKKVAGPGRAGPLSKSDHEIIEAFALSNAGTSDVNTATRRAKALAIALGKSSAVVSRAISKAAEKIASRAEDYVELHYKAAKVAAKKGDAAPAQWALERLTGTDEEGKKIRVLEPLQKGGDGEGTKMPVINIGVALGGQQNRPTVEVTPAPVRELPPQPEDEEEVFDMVDDLPEEP